MSPDPAGPRPSPGVLEPTGLMPRGPGAQVSVRPGGSLGRGVSWRQGGSPRRVVRSRATGVKWGGPGAQVSARPRGSPRLCFEGAGRPRAEAHRGGWGCLGAAPFCVVPLSSFPEAAGQRAGGDTLLAGGTPCVLEAEAVPLKKKKRNLLDGNVFSLMLLIFPQVPKLDQV